jgi:ABC-type lipoprotein export system ATPase subunit
MSLLRLEQIRRRFSDGSAPPPPPVLDGVDLSLAEGEVVALVGRSGVGKTTLLYVAAGLCRPDAGRVLFDGRDLARLSVGELARLRRRRIGLVFQNNLSLAALPVWENAAFAMLLEGTGRAAARRQAEAMLERVGLANMASASTAALSGGQRRRLGLARAMLTGPSLLLADEPTADLDEQTASQIERLLFDWLTRERRAGLIVTHEASIMRSAARVLRLEAGRLSEAADGEKPGPLGA